MDNTISNRFSVPMDNTISKRTSTLINNRVCQCALVNRFVPELMKYCCQEKVNKGNMKMFEYAQICQEKAPMIDVSRREEERIKSVWKKNGNKWTECPETGEIKFEKPDDS